MALTSVLLPDLMAPTTAMRFGTTAGSATSDTGTFRTAPLPWRSKSVRFAFSGDSDGWRVDGSTGYGELEVLDAIRAERPEFFIYLGDIVYTDSGVRGAADWMTLPGRCFRLSRE